MNRNAAYRLIAGLLICAFGWSIRVVARHEMEWQALRTLEIAEEQRRSAAEEVRSYSEQDEKTRFGDDDETKTVEIYGELVLCVPVSWEEDAWTDGGDVSFENSDWEGLCTVARYEDKCLTCSSAQDAAEQILKKYRSVVPEDEVPARGVMGEAVWLRYAVHKDGDTTPPRRSYGFFEVFMSGHDAYCVVCLCGADNYTRTVQQEMYCVLNSLGGIEDAPVFLVDGSAGREGGAAGREGEAAGREGEAAGHANVNGSAGHEGSSAGREGGANLHGDGSAADESGHRESTGDGETAGDGAQTDDGSVRTLLESFGEFQPHSVEGTGSKRVDIPVGTMNTGMAFPCLMEVSYRGTGSFVLRLYNDIDDEHHAIVERSGPYHGFVTSLCDTYTTFMSRKLDVTADGEWSITFSPLTGMEPLESGKTYEGDYVTYFDERSVRELRIVHDGPGVFGVSAAGMEGDSRVLAEVEGPYDETVAWKESHTLLAVKSDGPWSISLQ